MKKILNFSRVAIALFCFMLIGLTNANTATITFAPGTDKDPNKAGVQVCANDPVTINATPSIGDVAPFQWQLSDNGGAIRTTGSLAHTCSPALLGSLSVPGANVIVAACAVVNPISIKQKRAIATLEKFRIFFIVK